MRRSISLIVPALAVLVLITPPALGGRRDTTYVAAECGRLRIAPELIEFGCTGGLYVDHLTWFRWRRFRAAGGGLFHMNDCRPSCAEGTYHTEWGHIWLRNRARCEPSGRFAFQHVRIRYEGRLLGRRGDAYGHFGCG
jgi:hypothetical protein